MFTLVERNSRVFGHDRLAGRFDDLMNKYDVSRRLETLVDAFLANVSLFGVLVLDAGCGTGRASVRLGQHGATVVAVDIGIDLVRNTRQKSGCLGLVGDIVHLPFRDNSFDVVLSTEVIEHTPTPLGAVAECYRVVRPGGHLVLSTPNLAWHWVVQLANFLRLRRYDVLENFVSPRQLRAKMEELGGLVVEHVGIHAAPFQFEVLHPLLRMLDKQGKRLLPVMINQCIHVIKK